MPRLDPASARGSGPLPKISRTFHRLGLGHETLPCNYADRDFRLTNVTGKVAGKILLSGAGG